MKRLAATLLLPLALLFVSATPRLHAQGTMPTDGMGPVEHEETAMWENLKARNYDAMAAALTPEFVYVGAEGVSNHDASLTGMKMCSVTAYSLGKAQTRMLSKDIVLLTYSAHSAGDCGGGHTYDGNYNCSSLWVHRGGKWLALAHTETAAEQH